MQIVGRLERGVVVVLEGEAASSAEQGRQLAWAGCWLGGLLAWPRGKGRGVPQIPACWIIIVSFVRMRMRT